MTLRIEDDILFGHVSGEYDARCEAYMQNVRDEIQARHGYRLLLCDLRDIHSMTPEARRMITAWSRRQTLPGAIALFGTSFALLALASLVLRAARLLSDRAARFAFFATEQEARQWLASNRALFLGSRPWEKT